MSDDPISAMPLPPPPPPGLIGDPAQARRTLTRILVLCGVLVMVAGLGYAYNTQKRQAEVKAAIQELDAQLEKGVVFRYAKKMDTLGFTKMREQIINDVMMQNIDPIEASHRCTAIEMRYVTQLMHTFTPQASDIALRRLMAERVMMWNKLLNVSPEACFYEISHGKHDLLASIEQGRSRKDSRLVQDVRYKNEYRTIGIVAGMMSAKRATPPRTTLTPTQIKRAKLNQQKVMGTLAPEERMLLGQPNPESITPAERKLYCRAYLKMYALYACLPLQECVEVFRYQGEIPGDQPFAKAASR